MDTESLTTPSPELKQHAKDLKDHATQGAQQVKKDVVNVAQDVKDHATRGVQAVRDEAKNQLGDAKDKASDLFETARQYGSDHPLTAFGVGVLAGLVLATWRRR